MATLPVLGAAAPGRALRVEQGVRAPAPALLSVRRPRVSVACAAGRRRVAPWRATAALSPASSDFTVEPETRTWEWRGHRVSYERLGAANADDTRPPLCVVHGFGSNARHWRSLTTALARSGYTVFAPDLLGFGASAKPPVDYSPTLWAAQVSAFLDEVVEGKQAVVRL